MGGQGSGRRSVKAVAAMALLGAQMKLAELLYDGFDSSNKTRDDLRLLAEDAFKVLKAAQEEIERL